MPISRQSLSETLSDDLSSLKATSKKGKQAKSASLDKAMREHKGPGWCMAVGCGEKIPKYDKKGGSTSGWKRVCSYYFYFRTVALE